MNSLSLRFKKIHENLISGGLADGMSLEDIANKHGVELSIIEEQFKKGVVVEEEHTSNKNEAEEIAMDHLVEDPLYYDKLEKMENTDDTSTSGAAINDIPKSTGSNEIILSPDTELYKKVSKLWKIDKAAKLYIERYDNPFKLEIESKEEAKKIEFYVEPVADSKELKFKISVHTTESDSKTSESSILISIDKFMMLLLNDSSILKLISGV